MFLQAMPCPLKSRTLSCRYTRHEQLVQAWCIGNSIFVTLMPGNFYLGAKGKRGVGWVGAWALFTVNNLHSDHYTVKSDHGSKIAKKASFLLTLVLVSLGLLLSVQQTQAIFSKRRWSQFQLRQKQVWSSCFQGFSWNYQKFNRNQLLETALAHHIWDTMFG